MAGFDPGAFLEDTKHFDPDSFLADTEPAPSDQLPPEAIAGRQQAPLPERARAAARKMQQLGGLEHLDPDERHALKWALKQREIGTGDAMLGLGLNMAGGEMGDEAAGLAGGDTGAARDWLARAKEQHPVAGTVAQLLGGVASGVGAGALSKAAISRALPYLLGSEMTPQIANGVGKLANLAQGAMTGAGAGEDASSRITGAIGGGVMAHGANELAPAVTAMLANMYGAGLRGASKALKFPRTLSNWVDGLGADGPKPPPPPPPGGGGPPPGGGAPPGGPAPTPAPEPVTLTMRRPQPAPVEPEPPKMAAGAENAQPVPLADTAEKGTVRKGRPLQQSAEDLAAEELANAQRRPTRKMEPPEFERAHQDAFDKPFSASITPEQAQRYFDEVRQAAQARGVGDAPGKSLDELFPPRDPGFPDPDYGASGFPEPVDDIAALEKLRDAGQAREPWNAHEESAPYQTWMERHQSKSPAKQAAATFDNANASMSWKRANEVFSNGQSSTQPKPPPAWDADFPEPSMLGPEHRAPWDNTSRFLQDQWDNIGNNPSRAEAEQAGQVADRVVGRDPRKNERGFGAMDVLETLAGMKAAKMAGKVAMHGADKAGNALGAAGENWRPSAIASKLATDDSALSQLARRGGKLGQAGLMLLQTKQQQGPDAAKARAFVLAQQPWFREQFGQGTGEQAGSYQGATAPAGSW